MALSLALSTASSSSARSCAVHHASLVDPATHSPELMELIDIVISRPVIGFIVDTVISTIDYAMGRPSSSRHHTEYSNFTDFVTNTIAHAEVTTPTILVSLVYLDRAKPHLYITFEEWVLERAFLGALVVASKYVNDSTLKNIDWAICTGIFGGRDIGRIEREFLHVLDFDLGIAEHDLLIHHRGLLLAAPGHLPSPQSKALFASRVPRTQAPGHLPSPQSKALFRPRVPRTQASGRLPSP
ncbi:PHO85 cyclin-1 [Hypsizygus marmoreus]|uniref:PHO85 cyclin-1 n=1 Tax=Hypsizygus marmoreus TaxID=39966 RepID=A0A369J6M7_HYPMA|nr:PHO85 cyclin-1 [Hypsizygus marmoreus]